MTYMQDQANARVISTFAPASYSIISFDGDVCFFIFVDIYIVTPFTSCSTSNRLFWCGNVRTLSDTHLAWQVTNLTHLQSGLLYIYFWKVQQKCQWSSEMMWSEEHKPACVFLNIDQQLQEMVLSSVLFLTNPTYGDIHWKRKFLVLCTANLVSAIGRCHNAYI
jgi:hypothetical protein